MSCLSWYWPALLEEIFARPRWFYENVKQGWIARMTYEEFKTACTEDAFRAVINNNNGFKVDFVTRLGTPGYQLKEWEEEVFSRLMTLSSL